MTDEMRTKILRSASSRTCPGCGDDKIRGKSFCMACFMLLPVRMRNDLDPQFSSATTIQATTIKAADYLADKGITAPSSIFTTPEAA